MHWVVLQLTMYSPSQLWFNLLKLEGEAAKVVSARADCHHRQESNRIIKLLPPADCMLSLSTTRRWFNVFIFSSLFSIPPHELSALCTLPGNWLERPARASTWAQLLQASEVLCSELMLLSTCLLMFLSYWCSLCKLKSTAFSFFFPSTRSLATDPLAVQLQSSRHSMSCLDALTLSTMTFLFSTIIIINSQWQCDFCELLKLAFIWAALYFHFILLYFRGLKRATKKEKVELSCSSRHQVIAGNWHQQQQLSFICIVFYFSNLTGQL